MDHRRLLGVALAAVSACGYGSGALFAKSVYGAGIDWLALLYWRFLIGGAIVWAWTLLMSDNRTALRALPRRRVLALLGLGAFFVGNASTYYASLQTSCPWPCDRRHLPGARRRPPRSAGCHGLQGVGGPRGLVARDPSESYDDRAASRPRPTGWAGPDRCLADHLLGLHDPAAGLAGERRGETAASRTGGAGAETRPAVAFAHGQRHVGLLRSSRWRPGSRSFRPGPHRRLVRAAGDRDLLHRHRGSAFYASTARIGAAQTALSPPWSRSGRSRWPPVLRRVAGADPAPGRSIRHRRRHPRPDHAGGHRGVVVEGLTRARTVSYSARNMRNGPS